MVFRVNFIFNCTFCPESQCGEIYFFTHCCFQFVNVINCVGPHHNYCHWFNNSALGFPPLRFSLHSNVKFRIVFQLHFVVSQESLENKSALAG